MNAKITSFVKGLSNSALALRYVHAALDCGHAYSLTLVPYRGICDGCGAEMTSGPHCAFDKCACGTYRTAITFTPDPWNDAHIIEKIGDTVDCATCTSAAAQVEALRAMAPYSIHHARHNGRTGGQAGWRLYRLDHTSPSNFMLAGYAPDTPEVDRLLRDKKFATCSPTER